MRVENIKVDDELKKLLPPLSADELSGLEEDIKKHGVLDPIILWNGFIADGHNRYEICQKLGIEFVDIKELHKDSKAEVMEWIIDHQFARRNLTKSQIVLSREKVRKKYEEEGEERKREGKNQYSLTENLPQGSNKKRNPTTAEKIAEKIGVSDKTYRNMRLITFEGTPEQIKRMDKGGKGNGVSAIANEIRDRKDGVPNGFRKCTKCGEVKPLSEFGKGNARHCIKCASKVQTSGDAGTKKCLGCGLIKPVSDFYKGKNYCRVCAESRKATRDIKGNVITISNELRNMSTEEVIGDSYNKNREVEFHIDDLIEEIKVNSEKFLWSLENTFEIHPDIANGADAKKKIFDCIGEIISRTTEIRRKVCEGI